MTLSRFLEISQLDFEREGNLPVVWEVKSSHGEIERVLVRQMEDRITLFYSMSISVFLLLRDELMC
jgi:hypothetical protein